jgi:hypothetical protein
MMSKKIGPRRIKYNQNLLNEKFKMKNKENGKEGVHKREEASF